MQLRYRSYEKEYLDSDYISSADLFQTLKELHVINKYLGGYKATLNGMDDILKTKKPVKNILDIGFGGGDFIKLISDYAKKQKQSMFFYGVDLKSDCINYAESNLSSINNKKLICDDYRNISPALLEEIDVIHCSLFLHHLTDEEIISLFKFGKTNNCILLANDLHRNWFAYYSIKFLTAVFSKSWLVKNDACLSVKRAFKKGELELLLQRSGYKKYHVNWSWAFRYTIIAYE
jgi:2-polyprenyl-3-methyl-5-hydroxy-6-metoxy-1,4-benzoquinol methylase